MQAQNWTSICQSFSGQIHLAFSACLRNASRTTTTPGKKKICKPKAVWSRSLAAASYSHLELMYKMWGPFHGFLEKWHHGQVWHNLLQVKPNLQQGRGCTTREGGVSQKDSSWTSSINEVNIIWNVLWLNGISRTQAGSQESVCPAHSRVPSVGCDHHTWPDWLLLGPYLLPHGWATPAVDPAKSERTEPAPGRKKRKWD